MSKATDDSSSSARGDDKIIQLSETSTMNAQNMVRKLFGKLVPDSSTQSAQTLVPGNRTFASSEGNHITKDDPPLSGIDNSSHTASDWFELYSKRVELKANPQSDESHVLGLEDTPNRSLHSERTHREEYNFEDSLESADADSDVSGETQEENEAIVVLAKYNYEMFYSIPPGAASIAMVKSSSAGITGWSSCVINDKKWPMNDNASAEAIKGTVELVADTVDNSSQGATAEAPTKAQSNHVNEESTTGEEELALQQAILASISNDEASEARPPSHRKGDEEEALHLRLVLLESVGVQVCGHTDFGPHREEVTSDDASVDNLSCYFDDTDEDEEFDDHWIRMAPNTAVDSEPSECHTMTDPSSANEGRQVSDNDIEVLALRLEEGLRITDHEDDHDRARVVGQSPTPEEIRIDSLEDDRKSHASDTDSFVHIEGGDQSDPSSSDEWQVIDRECDIN